MFDTNTVYEIEFDVSGHYRDDFESWLSEEVVEWVSHESVASFEVFTNDQGLSPESKFVFEFETLKDWARFADSDAHENAVKRLNGFTETRNAVLWRRDSVMLDNAVSDGGNPQPTEHQSNLDAVISQ